MSNRDNFPKKVIEPLKARVSNRCSNPSCRVPTTGPTTDPEKVNNIGIAAHVTAASPGGPRYDSLKSKDERKSILNAIWLCSNCSIKIDRDPNKYSVEDLLSWKQRAENKAIAELGQKLPDDNYVVQSLSTVLTGQSSAFLPNILSNASKATSNALEKLDSRFSVKTNHVNGLTSFEIKAKETVNTQILVNPKYATEFIDKFTNFKKHGDKLVIDSQAIDIQGSPLLEDIFSQKGRLELTTNLKKKSIQKIWLKHPTTPEIFQFYNVEGNAVKGTSSMTFKGTSCENIISISYRTHHDQRITSNIKFSFIINLHKWDGKNIFALPYFDSIYEFLNKINEGWFVNISMEIEGKKILEGTINNFSESEYFKSVLSQLHFISMVSGICKKINKSLCYDHSYEYSARDHLRVNEINQILSSGVSVDKNSINENAKCTLEASEDLSNIYAVREAKGKPTSIRFEQLEHEKLTPFSQTLILPKFNHTLSEVTPIIITDISNLKPGDLVEIEWEPTGNCKYRIEPA